MCKIVKRGYVQTDRQEFNAISMEKLDKAGIDMLYLINQSYNLKSSLTFVGNHYLLSARQRLSLMRALSSKEAINIRKAKEVVGKRGIIKLRDSTVHIDGFNTIITLEVALSNSLILKCMDGTYRDLAGLRGTYHVIDKTELAIVLIGKELERLKIKKAIFFIDAPVSNSGKLKEKILEELRNYNFDVEVNNINNVDSVLEKLDNVITSDSIILDYCKSWFNLNKNIIENDIINSMCIDFNKIVSGG